SVGLIRRSRHQALPAGWRYAYPAYKTPTHCNRFCRPDKAKPPSGIARRMALCLSGLQNQAHYPVGLIRRSRHQAPPT
ncbi:hypothetical protein, partial [Kosakonia cowanii]|uniref:hypothetical protein n=1 Tax=Kosakonia cowanii TaxID=208223 RepID=UPI00289670A5